MALSGFLTEAVRLIPTAVAALTANRKTSAERRQQELLAQQQDIIRQAYDPNSELNRQQVAIENANATRGVARTIEELTRQQRRNIGMGRNPLFDNERADEILNRFQQTEAANAAGLAPERARNTILGMAQNYGGVANTYGGMIQNQANRQNTRSAVLTDLSKGVVDTILNRYGNQAPSIQQAMPDQKATQGQAISQEELDRRMGGQNMASRAFSQMFQRSVPRMNQGGIS